MYFFKLRHRINNGHLHSILYVLKKKIKDDFYMVLSIFKDYSKRIVSAKLKYRKEKTLA